MCFSFHGGQRVCFPCSDLQYAIDSGNKCVPLLPLSIGHCFVSLCSSVTPFKHFVKQLFEAADFNRFHLCSFVYPTPFSGGLCHLHTLVRLKLNKVRKGWTVWHFAHVVPMTLNIHWFEMWLETQPRRANNTCRKKITKAMQSPE